MLESNFDPVFKSDTVNVCNGRGGVSLHVLNSVGRRVFEVTD
jgi:hypothetical protein